MKLNLEEFTAIMDTVGNDFAKAAKLILEKEKEKDKQPVTKEEMEKFEDAMIEARINEKIAAKIKEKAEGGDGKPKSPLTDEQFEKKAKACALCLFKDVPYEILKLYKLTSHAEEGKFGEFESRTVEIALAYYDLYKDVIKEAGHVLSPFNF